MSPYNLNIFTPPGQPTLSQVKALPVDTQAARLPTDVAGAIPAHVKLLGKDGELSLIEQERTAFVTDNDFAQASTLDISGNEWYDASRLSHNMVTADVTVAETLSMNTPSQVSNVWFVPTLAALGIFGALAGGSSHSDDNTNGSDNTDTDGSGFTPPENQTGTVSISGTATVGQTLSATVTDADGIPDNIRYQWLADGQAIFGATGDSHTLTDNEAGKNISVSANYTDNTGHSEAPLSTQIDSVIDNMPPSSSSSPSEPKESGLNLDMARHFYTPEAIKGFIDTIHQAGGTFLHLHFSDNENYALESTALGQTVDNARQQSDGTYINPLTDKPFLSQAQLADIVSYAQDKNVELIPELDMPAHSRALLELLQLARGEDFVATVQVSWEDDQGEAVYQLDMTQEATLTLAKELIDEVSAMFGSSSQHFHIGGDEFLAAAADNNEYITFVNTIADYLADKGLTTRIWNDSIVENFLDGLNKEVEITYWHVNEGDEESADAGYYYASMPDFIEAGFSVLNYNSGYLYHLPQESHFSSLSQSDYQMYTLLREWELGIWDGTDASSMIEDSEQILGAALSIWSEEAGALKDTSIERFTAAQLDMMIRLTNAENDPSGQSKAELKSLLDNNYAKMEHDVYLDLARVNTGDDLDTGGLGKQKIYLLEQDVLDMRDDLEVFIRGDARDEIVLDSRWQQSEQTVSLTNPNYPADTPVYRAYEYGNDKLWIDEDISIITY